MILMNKVRVVEDGCQVDVVNFYTASSVCVLEVCTNIKEVSY